MNTNDYFFEIENCMGFIYHQKSGQKKVIDSVFILSNNFTPFFDKNHFYFYEITADASHVNKYFKIIKFVMNNDSVIYTTHIYHMVGIVKDCQCVFGNNTATITCDSAVYTIDLDEMKFK